MLISQCITERCENYSRNGDSLSLSIFDHNTENKIKYYVACVFVSALDVKCFVIKQREKPVTVYAGFRGYLYLFTCLFYKFVAGTKRFSSR